MASSAHAIPGATAGPARARRTSFRVLLRRSRPVLLPAITAILALSAWEFVVRYNDIPQVILPAPSAVFDTIVSNFGLLMFHTWQTASEAAAGLVLAIVCGVSLGMALTYSPLLRDAMFPNLVFFQLIPKVALAPLFIMWLGIGSISRLAFALFISFFPIVISTMAGLTNVDPNVIRMCRSLTATDWQIFLSVRFPFALPYIFNGLKIGVTMAMIGVIVGEFITSQAGLGYLILFGSSQADTPVIFASIAVLCTVGLAFFGIVAVADRIMRRWFGGAITG